MATPSTSRAGKGRPGPEDDAERLDRRDLLLLGLELRRRRRATGAQPKGAEAQRPTRRTR